MMAVTASISIFPTVDGSASGSGSTASSVAYLTCLKQATMIRNARALMKEGMASFQTRASRQMSLNFSNGSHVDA